MTMHTYTLQPKYLSSNNFQHFTVFVKKTRHDYKGHGHNSDCQRSNQVHTMMLTPTPIQYLCQVLTSNTLQLLRQSQDKILNSRSLQQGQTSYQGHTMMLHTYTLKPRSLPCINLTLSEIWPRQDAKDQGHQTKGQKSNQSPT